MGLASEARGTGPLIRQPPSSPQGGCLLGQSPEVQPDLGLHDNGCVIAPRLSGRLGVGAADGTVPEPLTTSRGTTFAQSAANCGNHARLGSLFTSPLRLDRSTGGLTGQSRPIISLLSTEPGRTSLNRSSMFNSPPPFASAPSTKSSIPLPHRPVGQCVCVY